MILQAILPDPLDDFFRILRMMVGKRAWYQAAPLPGPFQLLGNIIPGGQSVQPQCMPELHLVFKPGKAAKAVIQPQFLRNRSQRGSLFSSAISSA